MPRETILIPLKSLPVYEASAVFLSTIAYPDPRDKPQRERFRIATSRWAILERAKIDNEWRRVAQEIRPEIFLDDERLYKQTFERGSSLLARRVFCVAFMVYPHLFKTPVRPYGFEPTVGNLAGILADALGMSRESQKTIESKLWAPTKPVAHAAVTLSRFLSYAWRREEPWDDEYKLFNKNLMLGVLFYSDIVTLLVEDAERVRLRLHKIGRVTIKEQNTVQFSLD